MANSIPTIPQYYHMGIARGVSVIEGKLWNAAAHVEVKVTPATDEAILISGVTWSASDAFKLGASDTIVITPWGNLGGTTLTLASFEELIAISEYTACPGAAYIHKGIINFKPFIILKNSSTPADSFTVTYTGLTGIAGTEFLYVAAIGCKIDEADLGLGI
jgi:hypothetical protein